jgi:hypothetical protein
MSVTRSIVRKESHPTATLVIIRATSARTWQVVLEFGGDTGNPLHCATFASLGVARAAAPEIALRYTDADRVRRRRCRLTCSDHAVEDCPRAGEPLWRWQDSGNALAAEKAPSPSQSPEDRAIPLQQGVTKAAYPLRRQIGQMPRV